MTRLPTVGSDLNAWGDVLNEYLLVAHNADGTVKQAAIDAIMNLRSLPAIAGSDDKTLTALQLPGNSYGVRQTVTVMIYHGPIVLGTLQTDLDNFQAWNYTTITPDDLYDYLTGNRASLPEKPLLITFDDGLTTQFTVAYPELVTRGMKATFYVIPNFIDGTITAASFGGAEATSFSWANAQTMFANGMRIQSHTMSHISLLTMTDAQVVADFAAAKARIESQVPGETVRHVAYPYGVCAATAQQALAAANVRTGRTVSNVYNVASAGRNGFVTPFTPRLAVPCAGSNYSDVAQANFYNRLNLEPQLVKDNSFIGGGKGWALATGASADATTLRPGAAANSKSVKQIQQAGSVSSSTSEITYVGQYARLKGSVWIKTQSLGATGRAFVFVITYKPDGSTVISTTTYVTTVPDNQAWTQYQFDVFGDVNTTYVKMGLQVTGVASPTGTAWFAEPSLQYNTDRLLFA